jgi:hypothetical protein
MIGFIGGRVFAPRPSSQVNSAAYTTVSSVVDFVSRTVDPFPPGAIAPPTYGNPPIVTGGGTVGPWTDFGSVSYSTGLVQGYSQSTPGQNSLGDFVTFGPGGFINIVSNAAFQTATGGAVPAGTVLFSGIFSGISTLTQINAPSASCSLNPTCLASFNYHYQLVGAVSGNVSPILLQHLGLSPGTVAASGFVITLNFGFVGPTDNIGNPEGGMLSVVVPEPGTLALFGTGLMGLAGLIRRRMSS